MTYQEEMEQNVWISVYTAVANTKPELAQFWADKAVEDFKRYFYPPKQEELEKPKPVLNEKAVKEFIQYRNDCYKSKQSKLKKKSKKK